MNDQEIKEAEDKCFWEGSFVTAIENLPDEYCQVSVSDNVISLKLFGMEKGDALKWFTKAFPSKPEEESHDDPNPRR
jgi:hypothetical protein